ncbi:MAG: hypothetical protein ABID64_01055 [Nitrospirota bacterium]
MPSNQNLTTGEITGEVATGIAGDIGDIFGTFYIHMNNIFSQNKTKQIGENNQPYNKSITSNNNTTNNNIYV